MSDNTENIKSAFEKAKEKIDKLPTPTKEERLAWKGVPEGNRLAAKFLRGEGNLATALQKSDPDVRPYVLKGMMEVLVANIQLPKNEAARSTLNKALDGVRVLFPKKANVQDIAGKIQYVCEQHRTFGNQQRQQIYEQFKQQFQAQIQEALRRQGVNREVPANFESTPEFQQQWMRVKGQMDQQYEEHIEGFRQQLLGLA